MSFNWNSYSGSVLQEKDGSFFDEDVLTEHLVEFIRDNLGTVSLTVNSTPTSTVCYADYPIAENMKLPSCIVTVQAHEENSEYIGNFLFEHIDSGGGIASSGSYDTVYGSEKVYLIRLDVWADTPKMRNVIAGKIENLLQWHRSQESSELFNKGIKQLKTVSSGIIGFDDTDRYIKDVSYHTQNIMVYRRYLDLMIRAEVRYIDPTGSGSDNYLVGQLVLDSYLASGSTGEEVGLGSGTADLIWSGTFSGS